MESKSSETFGKEGAELGLVFNLYYPPPPANQMFSFHSTSLILDSSIWRTRKCEGARFEYLIGWELLDVEDDPCKEPVVNLFFISKQDR